MDWREDLGIPSHEEMDRRIEEADLPTFDEVMEEGLVPDYYGISDVDHKVDDDWNPLCLSVEVSHEHGGRHWIDFQYDDDGNIVRV